MDYKTGKPDKHIKDVINFTGSIKEDEHHDYIRQLAAYKMLFERDRANTKKYKVSHGVLVFLEPVDENSPKYNLKKGEFRNEKIGITDKMVAALEDTIKTVWRNISDLRFEKLPERDEAKCGSCHFDDICWA